MGRTKHEYRAVTAEPDRRMIDEITPRRPGFESGPLLGDFWWANSYGDMHSSEYFDLPNAPHILNLRHVTVNTV